MYITLALQELCQKINFEQSRKHLIRNKKIAIDKKQTIDSCKLAKAGAGYFPKMRRPRAA